MAQQIKAKPTKRKKAEEPAVEETAKVFDHTSVEDVDALLDEIDAVLEENANEVLQAYHQKGGE